MAIFESMTINGETYTSPSSLSDLEGVWNNVQNALSGASVTASLVTTMSNNSGGSSSIQDNKGFNLVFVTIFYPSVELTGSINVTINGALEAFDFEKVATS